MVVVLGHSTPAAKTIKQPNKGSPLTEKSRSYEVTWEAHEHETPQFLQPEQEQEGKAVPEEPTLHCSAHSC